CRDLPCHRTVIDGIWTKDLRRRRPQGGHPPLSNGKNAVKTGPYRDRRKKWAISPMTPRRKVSTQATKITPWITVTHWPKPARYCCMAMMTNAPTTGPKMVPRPPTSVISTISPDIDQCTSVSEAFCDTNTFSDPANPESVADRMKASSLYWSVL